MKLTFGEPKFYVNEEKKVVTCVIGYRLNYSDSKLCGLMAKMGEMKFKSFIDNPLNDYWWQIDAQAKLDPLDEFDVEIGKKVARAKAESKAYDYVSRCLCSAWDSVTEELCDMINNFCDKAGGVIEHNNRYIDQF